MALMIFKKNACNAEYTYCQYTLMYNQINSCIIKTIFCILWWLQTYSVRSLVQGG